MTRKLSFVALLAALVITGACESPTKPSPPPTPVTPTALVIKTFEFRVEPNGLGDPAGTPVPTPVTAGMKLQVVVTVTSNVENRSFTTNFRVYRDGTLVKDESRPNGMAAMEAQFFFKFQPDQSGSYRAEVQVSDAYGTPIRDGVLEVK